MGKVSLYYLIARDRKTDDFSVIPVQGKRGTALEEIDLFTTQYSSSEEFQKALQENGILSYEDMDFFIVTQSKVQGKTVLRNYGVLYSEDEAIRDIAKNSLQKNMEASSAKIDHILDYFAGQIARKPALYDLVITGQTNVYEKYAKYFAYSRAANSGSIKFRDGGWARTSYPLIHNVLDAMNHVSRSYSLVSDQMHRSLLEKDLLRVTDPSYDENQLSFFESLELDRTDHQISSIMRKIEALPRDVFITRGATMVFNEQLFSEYQSQDLEKFQTFLSEDLRLKVEMLLIHRDYLDHSAYPFGNDYLPAVQKDQQEIIQYLRKHSAILDSVSEWCLLYQTYRNKELGDVDGREYQKRKED